MWKIFLFLTIIVLGTCASVTVCIHVCTHTHSWLSHSCVRASSGCRSDVHPGRRASPVLWILSSALPSGSRTASHSCIAPLEIKTQTLKSVKHYIETQKEQVSAFISRGKAKSRRVTQLVEQAAADVGQSPKRQQRCHCVDTQGCFSTDLFLKAAQRRNREIS